MSYQEAISYISYGNFGRNSDAHLPENYFSLHRTQIVKSKQFCTENCSSTLNKQNFVTEPNTCDRRFEYFQIAEFESWFLVDIYEVGAGARVDGNRRYTNVTVAESDHPFGLFQYSLQSRCVTRLFSRSGSSRKQGWAILSAGFDFGSSIRL